ncbi:MAG: hypothetical protein ACE366_31550 [Bradymonadia bacterium]
MTRTPLKEAVQQHIEAHDLTEAQFAALERLQQPEQQRPQRWLWLVAVAALVALTVWGVWGRTEQSVAIASEVAKNHLKLKPLEITTSDMGAVQGFFDTLDFVPIESRQLAASGWRLSGARHCSVQGQEAAQLRGHLGQDEAPISVYMTAYDAERFGPVPSLDRGEVPLRLHDRGLAITLWVEHGVLMVQAGGP